MTQTLSDLRSLIPPPAVATGATKRNERSTKKKTAKAETKYSIDALLAVMPENARAAANWALSTFPKAFPLIPHKIRPLAIGISSELQKHVSNAVPAVSGDDMSIFLSWWCRRGAYLRATISGGQRVSLNGDAAEEVTEKAMEHAKFILERKMSRRVKLAPAITEPTT